MHPHSTWVATWVLVCLFHNLGYSQSCSPQLPNVFINTDYKLPNGKIFTVNSGGNLQAAIDQSNPGDIIEIQAGATFSGNFRLRKKSTLGWIYIRSSQESTLPKPGVRVGPADANRMPKILATKDLPAFSAEAGAAFYRLVGLEIGMPLASTDQFNLVSFGSGAETSLQNLPNNLIVDRCYIHGNSNSNVKVGVALNCAYGAIIDSHIDNIHAESGVSTFESKTISCFNGPGPFKITNNYLEASHINILFGGAVSAIQNLVPSDVEIRCNLMTKKVQWNPTHPDFIGKVWGVKNIFEIKSGQRMLLEGNIFENSWPSDVNVAGGPQHGYAILLTTRDENKNMPWTVIQDIIFRNNIIRHANCGVSIYGSEGKGERRIVFQNNVFEDIGGNWGANDKTGRLFQVTDVEDLCIDHNTMLHSSNNILFAYGIVKNIVLTNNISEWFDGFQGTLFTNWERNIFIRGKPNGFSSTNYFPANIADIQFVNYSKGDYRLASTSKYKNGGTDGKDIGCDINILETIISDCNALVSGANTVRVVKNNFSIQPNPNNGQFYIPILNGHEYKIEIYNNLGLLVPFQKVNESGKVFIKLKENNCGFYFLHVMKEGQPYSTKIIMVN